MRFLLLASLLVFSFPVTDAPAQALEKGQVFVDKNNDGVFDGGDELFHIDDLVDADGNLELDFESEGWGFVIPATAKKIKLARIDIQAPGGDFVLGEKAVLIGDSVSIYARNTYVDAKAVLKSKTDLFIDGTRELAFGNSAKFIAAGDAEIGDTAHLIFGEKFTLKVGGEILIDPDDALVIGPGSKLQADSLHASAGFSAGADHEFVIDIGDRVKFRGRDTVFLAGFGRSGLRIPPNTVIKSGRRIHLEADFGPLEVIDATLAGDFIDAFSDRSVRFANSRIRLTEKQSTFSIKNSTGTFVFENDFVGLDSNKIALGKEGLLDIHTDELEMENNRIGPKSAQVSVTGNGDPAIQHTVTLQIDSFPTLSAQIYSVPEGFACRPDASGGATCAVAFREFTQLELYVSGIPGFDFFFGGDCFTNYPNRDATQAAIRGYSLVTEDKFCPVTFRPLP